MSPAACGGAKDMELATTRAAASPNFSGKLQRGPLRYGEAVELADALGYDLVWRKRGKEG